MMKVVIYETDDPLREGDRFIAWLTEERAIVDKDRKKTGETKTVFLPVYFFGETYLDAAKRASAFWNDEKAKKAARESRGKALGKLRAKDAKKIAA